MTPAQDRLLHGAWCTSCEKMALPWFLKHWPHVLVWLVLQQCCRSNKCWGEQGHSRGHGRKRCCSYMRESQSVRDQVAIESERTSIRPPDSMKDFFIFFYFQNLFTCCHKFQHQPGIFHFSPESIGKSCQTRCRRRKLYCDRGSGIAMFSMYCRTSVLTPIRTRWIVPKDLLPEPARDGA